jgi:hypothetical protein
MKYSQPEVSVLGKAGKVIQRTGEKGFPDQFEFVDGLRDFVPVYNLDE